MAGNALCRNDYEANICWQLRSFGRIQRDKEVVARFCAAIFIGCESCANNTPLEDLLLGRVSVGGQVNSSNFVIEVDDVGLRHYSFFCSEGHFSDDVSLPPVTQIALNQVVEPVLMLVKT